MGLRLPQADINFRELTNTSLASYAQNVHDKMLANVGFFPTPPVSMAALQTSIDFYRLKLAAALKGTKADTASKNAAAEFLKLQLKQLAAFVNRIVWAGYENGSVINTINMRGDIEASGFKVSKDPAPAMAQSGLAIPIVKTAISTQAGTLHLLLRQYKDDQRGTKTWQVEYRTSAIPSTIPVPAGPWFTSTFTGSNIDVTGLESGKSYDYRVAAIGGLDTRLNQQKPVNFTPVQSIVVV